jgi:hypothetical protein
MMEVRGDIFSGMNRSPSLPELLSLSFREMPAGKKGLWLPGKTAAATSRG